VDELALIMVTNIMKVFIILAPFLAIYYFNRRLENAAAGRSIAYFYAGLALCVLNAFGIIATRTLPLWGAHVPPAIPLVLYLSLVAGSMLLYWFALTVRERQTGESAHEKVMDILPLLMLFSVFFIGVLWGMHPQHDLGWALQRFSYVGYVIFALCYLESGEFLRRFGVRSWYAPSIASIVLLLHPLILIHNQMRILFGYIESTPEMFTLLPFTLGTLAGLIAILPEFFFVLEMRKGMPAIDERRLESMYVRGILQFLTKTSEVMGGATLTTFRSTIEGYNRRFNRNIKADDTIKLSGLGSEEWPEFIRFMLNVYYQCIGPLVFECTEGIEVMESAADELGVRYS
jgi:hypothetical protein